MIILVKVNLKRTSGPAVTAQDVVDLLNDEIAELWVDDTCMELQRFSLVRSADVEATEAELAQS